MPFMYLHLRADKERQIHATVKSQGEMKTHHLGTENSRWSSSPFAVFQLESFDGIECIDTDELVAELRRRMTPKQLMQRIEFQFTSEELLEMVAKRMP